MQHGAAGEGEDERVDVAVSPRRVGVALEGGPGAAAEVDACLGGGVDARRLLVDELGVGDGRSEVVRPEP